MSDVEHRWSSTAPPARHLSCDERKVLVASLITLAAESEHLELAGARAARACRAVRDQALALAARALDASDDRRLDEFLDGWARDTARAVRQHAGASALGEHRTLRDFAVALRSDVEAQRCRACPGAEEELCAPSLSPDVAARGACTAELQRIFGDAIALARALYLRAGVAPDVVRGVRPTLCITRLPPRVGRLLPDLPLDASCWFDGAGKRRCVVVVALPIEELSLRVMRGVPYVLLHELVAHAFQRLGAAERGTSARDPVAEGWMDFVARVVFVRAHHHPSRRRRARAAWSADVTPGLELSAARRASRGGATPAARLGYAVAERLWAMLVAMRGARGLAEFLRLSCQLNVLALSEEERERLVHALAGALSRRGEGDAGAREVAGLLRRYCATGDIATFVAGGSSL